MQVIYHRPQSYDFTKFFYFNYIMKKYYLAGSMMNLLLVENQWAQEFRMKGGSQKIAQKLVTKIGPHRVLLNHEAIEIDQTGDRPKVLFQNGVAVSCKKVIITLPPNCIANLRFEPPLKHSKVKLKFLKQNRPCNSYPPPYLVFSKYFVMVL